MAPRSLTPDITIQVRPDDYPRALEVDHERWDDTRTARRAAWKGRPVFPLLKGTEARSFWSMKAFEGERIDAERAQLITSLLTSASFRSVVQMERTASERLVAHLGRALTSTEKAAVVATVAELWQIATVDHVLVFEITPKGREALDATCADCFTPIDAGEYLCASCRATHVPPPPRVA